MSLRGRLTFIALWLVSLVSIAAVGAVMWRVG
jgi:hypothetical protein